MRDERLRMRLALLAALLAVCRIAFAQAPPRMEKPLPKLTGLPN